jgi:hypothetical protein
VSNTIYSFPDFKAPEKTSAWTNAEKERIARMLEDPELRKAKERTELIKQHMSPPGALGLPTRLEAARLKYGITDAFFRVQASFDRIFVFPLSLEEGEKAEKTAGGIYKPATTKLRDLQEGNRGVLISAGLTAMDRLMSHGYELGDIVITNKNVPFARRCETIGIEALHYLVMREADLAGNESQMERIRAGEQRIIDAGDEFNYEHQVAQNDNGDWSFKKKKSVYVNDTW